MNYLSKITYPTKISYDILSERKTGLDERISPIYFDSIVFNKQKTKVFAYLGVPTNSSPQTPAVVLVHGGNGRAYEDWVKLWVDRGYYAIAFDSNATMFSTANGDFAANPFGGPKGYGDINCNDCGIEDTWFYHTSINTLICKDILKSITRVNCNKISVAGISWGGVIALNLLSIDREFLCGAITYSTAFLCDGQYFMDCGLTQTNLGEKYKVWHQTFDPYNYIPNIKCPILIVRGKDETVFTQNMIDQTYQLFKCKYTLIELQSLPHSQEAGSNLDPIFEFVNQNCIKA